MRKLSIEELKEIENLDKVRDDLFVKISLQSLEKDAIEAKLIESKSTLSKFIVLRQEYMKKLQFKYGDFVDLNLETGEIIKKNGK